MLRAVVDNCANFVSESCAMTVLDCRTSGVHLAEQRVMAWTLGLLPSGPGNLRVCQLCWREGRAIHWEEALMALGRSEGRRYMLSGLQVLEIRQGPRCCS